MVANQRRQVHRVVRRQLGLLDLVRDAALHVQAVEVLLGLPGGLLPVVARRYLAREGAF